MKPAYECGPGAVEAQRPGSIDWISTYWQNQDGSSSLDLSGSAAGAVIQTVNLLPGIEYTLTFYMSGNPVYGPTTKRMTVRTGQYVGGSFVAGTVAQGDFVYDTAAHGTTRTNMQWQLMTFSFTALVPVTTIGFFSGTNTAYGPARDNVSLAGVPEPGLPILFATLLLALPLGRTFLKK